LHGFLLLACCYCDFVVFVWEFVAGGWVAALFGFYPLAFFVAIKGYDWGIKAANKGE